MSEDIAIKVENISKIFKLPHENYGSLKSTVVNFYRHDKGYEMQKALIDISFEVKKGEFFGIIGRNGSGKSTLLKMLAGIYEPNTGNITVNGSLTPFIELGVGFNQELTGRENVFLNGALLGFSRKEMTKMYDDIVDFAELEKFMDQKLKNYSSGMQVRLAFSIAIRAEADIVVLDEVLAVGDAAFQQKCFDIFAELKKKGTTIVLVTHDMNSVMRFCDRAILINDGLIRKQGKPSLVADTYLELNYEPTPQQPKQENTLEQKGHDTSRPVLGKVSVCNQKGIPTHKFEPGATCKVSFSFTNLTGKSIHFGFQIYSEADVYCFGTNTKIAGLDPVSEKEGKVSIELPLNLVPGKYYITIASLNNNATTLYNYRSKITDFRVAQSTQQGGVALLDNTWKIT